MAGIAGLKRVTARYEKLPRYWQRYATIVFKEAMDEIETLKDTGATWSPGRRETASMYFPTENPKKKGNNSGV